MPKIKLLDKLNSRLNFQLRDLNTRVCHWVLQVKSQPLTVREKPAIVFSPVQDDETIDCGGIIALKRSQGIPVMVVFLTDEHYGRLAEWVKPEEIIHVCQQEAISALDNLSMEKSETDFLGHTDSFLGKLSSELRQPLIAHPVALLKFFSTRRSLCTLQQRLFPQIMRRLMNELAWRWRCFSFLAAQGRTPNPEFS
ncbi:PIG-L family deacetylase [Scytonema tolypothrichoides VB-61278]|nr:PIG-L family deacetylase [Scytonema tolypothrichoides VB-61278]